MKIYPSIIKCRESLRDKTENDAFSIYIYNMIYVSAWIAERRSSDCLVNTQDTS